VARRRGTMDGMPRRPTAGQWLRYAFGGRLPPPLHEWVRHDLTDADWRWRLILRVLVQCVIPAVVLGLLPAELQVRVLMIALVLIGAVFTAAAYGDELRDRRLRQHGLLPPQQPEP
jgi:undecaprenyl pyrophosphate phosphatase UppP